CTAACTSIPAAWGCWTVRSSLGGDVRKCLPARGVMTCPLRGEMGWVDNRPRAREGVIKQQTPKRGHPPRGGATNEGIATARDEAHLRVYSNTRDWPATATGGPGSIH